MSIPRSPRFVEDKEIIPPRARWHGDLPSTLGHATLSRVKSSPSMRFGTSPQRHRPTTANSSCHAYNVPLSTLSRVSSAKWGSRKDLRGVEVMKSKRDKDLAVGPYAQYPGEMPSTIGATANVKLSRIPSSVCVSIKRRPPSSIVTPEQQRYNAHHMAGGQSTFGKLTTGTIPSSAATLIPRAARERRVSAVSPEAQFPSGQVSSFGAKGLQRLSTSRQSARTLMKARPEVNPIQKQWTDVGPGAYSPPSTFGDGKGAAAVLPKNLSGSRRAATASGRRGRRQRSGAPGRLGQTSQVSSLKDWLAQHGGSSSEGAAAGAGGGKGASGVGSGKQAQPQSLSAWLEQYGKPTRGTMFQHMETRRPRLSRGMSMGKLRDRTSATPSPIKVQKAYDMSHR